MYKNRLQEHAQKSGLPMPLYITTGEGPPHAQKFKSSVLINGVRFEPRETFSLKKEAEQNAARVALNEISKVSPEPHHLISSDTTFCKSIIQEFSVKMKLEKPEYECSPSGRILPAFISSLKLSGKTFQGTAGRNKNEAHQLAARAAIKSILANGDLREKSTLSDIIMSKEKLYAAIGQTGDQSDGFRDGQQPQSQPQDGQQQDSGVTPAVLDAVIKKEICSELTLSPQVNALNSETIEAKEGAPKLRTSRKEGNSSGNKKSGKSLKKSQFKKCRKSRK